jgi:hypothetical protein
LAWIEFKEVTVFARMKLELEEFISYFIIVFIVINLNFISIPLIVELEVVEFVVFIIKLVVVKLVVAFESLAS